LIAANINIILVVTGVLTLGAALVFFVPDRVLKIVFGVSAPDDVTRLVTRHWGLVVGLVGSLLVYAGHHPELRVPVMAIAATEKLALAGLVLGSSLRRRGLLMIIVAADVVMAILYLIVLL
jgi:hypothetical protein